MLVQLGDLIAELTVRLIHHSRKPFFLLFIDICTFKRKYLYLIAHSVINEKKRDRRIVWTILNLYTRQNVSLDKIDYSQIFSAVREKFSERKVWSRAVVKYISLTSFTERSSIVAHN